MKRLFGTMLLAVLISLLTTPKCFSQDDSDVSDGQIPVGRGFAVGDYNIRINYSGGSNLELEIIVAIDDRNNPGSTIGSTANFTKIKTMKKRRKNHQSQVLKL